MQFKFTFINEKIKLWNAKNSSRKRWEQHMFKIGMYALKPAILNFLTVGDKYVSTLFILDYNFW